MTDSEQSDRIIAHAVEWRQARDKLREKVSNAKAALKKAEDEYRKADNLAMAKHTAIVVGANKPAHRPHHLTFDQLGMTPAALRGEMCLKSIREAGLVKGLIEIKGHEEVDSGWYVCLDQEGDQFTLRRLAKRELWIGEEVPWQKDAKLEVGMLLRDATGQEWFLDDYPPVVVRGEKGKG